MVGISTVHENRTLRDMDRAGLVERSEQTIHLLDMDRQKTLSGLQKRDYDFELEWIDLLL